MGAMPGNKAWHVYKRGLGPTLDQLFMQSNFGIVTKMGVWLMPEPEVYMPLWLRVLEATTTSAPLIDTLRELMLDGTIEGVPQILNTVCSARCSRARRSGTTATGRSPTTSIDQMARELEIGRWIMRFALYGDEAVVDHRFAKIKARVRADPRRRGLGHEARPDDIADAGAPGRAHPGRRAEPRHRTT